MANFTPVYCIFSVSQIIFIRKQMEKQRKMPRQGCSIPCSIFADDQEIEAYVADVSASGLSLSPKSGDIPEAIAAAETLKVRIDMEDFSDMGGVIEFEGVLRWRRGLLVGLEMVSVDKPNFKKWWYLIYKLFFPQ